MPSKDVFLSLNSVTVRYLNDVLFRDLSFEVKKGEHWALVGESGSGKTNLLQTLAGNFNIVNGTVEHLYFQRFIEENPQPDPLFTFHRLVAKVSQKHDFRNLSNTSEFYYQQRYHSYDSEDAPTVESYLAAVEPAVADQPYWTYAKVVETFSLQGLLNKELIKLSNGETKRLLMAAALLKQPKLLLLDNPLTGLDVQTRASLNSIVSEIAASGITVVMATSPTEIPDAISHIAVLKERKVLSVSPKKDYRPEPEIAEPDFSAEQERLLELLSEVPAQTFDTVVQLQDVSVRYGEKLVLDNVNWQIKAGERWALLGSNGAGKTTLLSLINGDNPQSYAKKITLFDRKRGSGESIWDIKKKIGFMSPELFQYFPYGNTCLQVIETGFYDTLGLFRESEPQKAAVALQWMDLLGIASEAAKQIKLVSASTQRLCLLARALVKSPPLLILDEPCQGLDRQQQQHFKSLVEAVCRHRNTTLIYVTHYQEEIPASVTRVLHLEAGKVKNDSYF